jgi:hypothetical protein
MSSCGTVGETGKVGSSQRNDIARSVIYNLGSAACCGCRALLHVVGVLLVVHVKRVKAFGVFIPCSQMAANSVRKHCFFAPQLRLDLACPQTLVNSSHEFSAHTVFYQDGKYHLVQDMHMNPGRERSRVIYVFVKLLTCGIDAARRRWCAMNVVPAMLRSPSQINLASPRSLNCTSSRLSRRCT